MDDCTADSGALKITDGDGETTEVFDGREVAKDGIHVEAAGYEAGSLDDDAGNDKNEEDKDDDDDEDEHMS